MCDTFVCLGNKTESGFPIFGKNSDRDPNEPQIFTFIPKGDNEYSKKIKTTYIEIEPYKKTYSVFLSKPVWLWGGEMGINEAQVAIGNEAVFTKAKDRNIGLTGMDIIRIALETCVSAFEALMKIIELIEKYGQGGNCGYEKKIFYHNSFLISDRSEVYVLETIDKLYAYKKISDFYNISNKLSIGSDYDGAHPEVKKGIDIEKFYSDRLYTYFSGAKVREKRGRELLQQYRNHNLKSFIQILSDRKYGFASMRNICMNAGGGLVSSQTTASMIVEYGVKNIIWFTMSPNPEISLFKPVFFTDESNPLNIKREEDLTKTWKLNNLFFRMFILNYEDNLDKINPLKNECQNKIFELIEKAELDKLSNDELNEITKKSLDIENEYREKGLKLMENTKNKKYFYFTSYWHNENRKLFEEEKSEELKILYKQYLF